MKKIILYTALVVTIAGCSDNNSTDSTQTDSTVNQTADTTFNSGGTLNSDSMVSGTDTTRRQDSAR